MLHCRLHRDAKSVLKNCPNYLKDSGYLKITWQTCSEPEQGMG